MDDPKREAAEGSQSGAKPVAVDRVDALARLAAIRHEQQLPDNFDADVLDEAERAASRVFEPTKDRVDLRALDFVTLDPASSTDLDQAFAISSEGDDIVLHYALADVAAFAPHGGAITTEAWSRGVTVYAPDHRVPVYPAVISQRAASLLPDGPRPAIVVEVVVRPNGEVKLRSAQQAIVQSRAKLAYEKTTAADLDPLIMQLHQRITVAERARGATKVDWPEQEVVSDPSAPGGYRVVLRPMRASEEINSSLSLAANIAMAQLMQESRTGLFRVMAEPDRQQQQTLRRIAKGLGITWPGASSLRELIATLDPHDGRHAKFLLEARRAGRGASYAVFDPKVAPWHSALACTYAHGTAPMRRLADRYVLDTVLALTTGSSSTGDVATIEPILAKLPKVMSDATRRANAVDGAVIDLLEAIALEGRVNEEFGAVVVDGSGSRVTVQLADPPVRAAAVGKLSEAIVANLEAIAAGSDLGEEMPAGPRVRVRLAEVDIDRRRVRFELLDADS